MTLTLTQKDLMKKWIDRALQDISILTIAYCPLCDEEYDVDIGDEDIAVSSIKSHIEFFHTFNELKVYHNK